MNERGTLTSWRSQTEGQLEVKRWKKSEPASGTHPLESADGGTVRIWRNVESVSDTHQLEGTERGTSQDMEGILASEGHLLSREYGGRDESAQGENPSERASYTHLLERAEGGTSQDMERISESEGNSLAGECRGRQSGHEKI
jgi:hypothetical protein